MAENSLTRIGLSLRFARSEDKKTLFRWRNIEEIVALSSSRRHVTWDEHSAWFDQALMGDRCIILIVEAKGEPIGLVRFDSRGNDGSIISIYLIPGETGKGRGTALIQAACNRAITAWPHLQWVEAKIRSDNERSIVVFRRAGFLPLSAEEQKISDDHARLQWQVPNVSLKNSGNSE